MTTMMTTTMTMMTMIMMMMNSINLTEMSGLDILQQSAIRWQGKLVAGRSCRCRRRRRYGRRCSRWVDGR